jgi:hypothetical protein
MAKTEPVKPAKAKALAPIIYYCNKGTPTFHIPEYETDDAGNIVKIDGKPKKLVLRDADGNNPRKVEKKITFDRLPIIDPKTKKPDASRRVGIFILSPDKIELWDRKDEIITLLNDAKKHQLNGILTEAEFKQGENALAFALSEENESLKAQVEELQGKIALLEDGSNLKK